MNSVKDGTIDLIYAEVDWSGEPTERDKIGCDGLYCKEVRLKKSAYYLAIQALEEALIAAKRKLAEA